jgi:predicted transcriptional regulator of viral defense system
MEEMRIRTKSSKPKLDTPRWDSFLNFFREQINEPSESHLTSRCWRRKDLLKVISDIRKKNVSVLKTTFHSSLEALQRLETVGWLRKIDVDVEVDSLDLPSPSAWEFFLVDMEAAPFDRPFANELLQAAKPDGVICFLSAIALHSLTTQRIPHHHISTLRSEVTINPLPQPNPQKVFSPSHSKRNPLGTYVFSYEGAGFYSSTRMRKRVVGIQKKIINPRTQLRITDLEQTLLDTFSHPAQSGGLTIITEAWENGLEIISQSRLATYLKQIDDKNLVRRTAALLEMFDVKVSDPELASVILKSKTELSTSAPQEVIPLFKGETFSTLNNTWGVRIP